MARQMIRPGPWSFCQHLVQIYLASSVYALTLRPNYEADLIIGYCKLEHLRNKLLNNNMDRRSTNLAASSSSL